MLFKPASEDTVATPPVPPTAKVPTLPAVEVDTSATHNSNLKTFKQRDPFQPLSVLKNADSNGNTSSSGSGNNKSTASSAGSSPSSPSGSSSPSSSPSSSSPTLPSSTTPSTPSTSPTTKWFRYTADISFGKSGAEKAMKGITDLTMLPDKQTAAIVFMGVSSDAKGAVFFIADPAFTPSGEGECNDKQDCRFIKLTLDAKKNEETFTSLYYTTVYKLKLVKLNREFIEQPGSGRQHRLVEQGPGPWQGPRRQGHQRRQRSGAPAPAGSLRHRLPDH